MNMSNTNEVSGKSAKVATHRALASESRQALLGVLRRRQRPIDATEAGEAVDLHRNTARVHLRQLESNGLVKRVLEHRTTPGRPRVLYQIVPSSSPDDHRESGNAEYRDLARLLADQLAEDTAVRYKALRAGRRWATALEVEPLPRRVLSRREAIEIAAHLLDGLGFDPEPSPASDPDCIRLHRCPFADVARENRSVVCAVHLGMLKATFERLDTSVSVAGLDPFVADDPLLCVVRLAKKPAKPKSLVQVQKRLENS
jgi:predicted ArsR family transcriptional regulator